MADQQNLDSSTQSDDLPPSQSSSASSSSDPTLSRSLSSSRLNAGAPEFVPGRAATPPPPPPPQPRMMIPAPPPPGMLHMYHHPPPFRVPIQGPVPMPPPPHMIPGQNQHPHHLPHHIPHHQSRHVSQHFVPVRNHGHHDYQQRGGGGEQDSNAVVKRGDHDRRKDHKKDPKKDHGDSGATVSIDPRSGLPEDTVQKIVNQVEYYFSDLNLATTDHLIRFINKDPEGNVPIHVVASFKKIKAVISSNSQLAAVLQSSSKLVVSEDGKKVRRQHPITDSSIKELQSRIVVAENLPEDHCYQNLLKIFSAVGSVKNIRTCQPQNSGSGAPSAARTAKSDGALFTNKVHAFVEYETVELAEKAVAELNEEGNWRSGLRVHLMLKHHHHQTKDQKHVQGRGRKGHDAEAQHEEEDEAAATSEQQHPNDKKCEESLGEWDNPDNTVGEEHGNEKVGGGGGQRKGRNRGRGKGRGRGQPHHHFNHNPNQNVTVPSEQPKQQQPPPGPRMPDGTRGFSMGRGKAVALNTE
ncbi:PREDICTED: la-related protein 6B-like [Tarenaya hassleriana]|uniref:la-related protein 6B-like n=1 Tax=Tarenaya hassleriana TaxID=28532 RepID=UPI00053C43AA|nr:PREDICTED: la-related protein 6B-like [Tarenaya hassleriana]